MAEAFYAFLAFFDFTHPMHPVVVTLLIGPVMLAIMLQVVAHVFKKPEFFKTARHLTVAGLIFWFPTVIVGVIDWIYFYGASPDMEEILWKSIGAGFTFVFLISSVLLFKKKKEDSPIFLVLYLLAAAAVSFVGFKGGDIVFSGKEHGGASSTIQTSSNEEGWKSFEVGGFNTQWSIADGNISVRLSYATEGWIGIGFGSTTMKDSHIVMGYIADNGTAVVEDHFGNAANRHASKEALARPNTLVESGGSYENGVTTIWFTMPLRSSDPADPVLVRGEEVDIILARSTRGKNLTAYHGNSEAGGHYTVRVVL